MIQILTGPIRSGKTTALWHWSKMRSDTGGVLSPDVGALRSLHNVRTSERIAWQKQEVTDDTDLIIGRFVFDQRAFSTAVGWLDAHLMDPEIGYVILDEIGPLELKGRGWDPWLRGALDHFGEKTLIVVVRDFLLDEVVEKYGWHTSEVVDRGYFE